MILELNDAELEQFWYFANTNSKILGATFVSLDDEAHERELAFLKASNATVVVDGMRFDSYVGIVYESVHAVQSMTMTEQLQLIADKTESLTTRRAIQAVINGELDDSHIAVLA